MAKLSDVLVGIALWLLSAVALAAYLAAELLPSVQTIAYLRMVFILVFWAGAFIGTRLLSKTLPGDRRGKIMRWVLWLMMAVYAFFCLNLTLIDTLYRRVPSGPFSFKMLVEYADTGLNLVPFATIKRYINGFISGRVSLGSAFLNLAGNAFIATPFAIFWPLIWDGPKRALRFLVTLTAIVCLIEIAQFFTRTGTCDIDDVILNVSGAFLVWLFAHIPPVRRRLEEVTDLPYREKA